MFRANDWNIILLVIQISLTINVSGWVERQKSWNDRLATGVYFSPLPTWRFAFDYTNAVMQASCDSQDQVLSFRRVVRHSVVVVDVNSKVVISAGMKSTGISINLCAWFQQSLEQCASSHLEAKGLFFARTLMNVTSIKCKCPGGITPQNSW